MRQMSFTIRYYRDGVPVCAKAEASTMYEARRLATSAFSICEYDEAVIEAVGLNNQRTTIDVLKFDRK
jgi:hypothetical protein